MIKEMTQADLNLQQNGDNIDLESDEDISPEEINILFTQSECLCELTTSPDSYILQVTSTGDCAPHVALSNSENQVVVYNLNGNKLNEVARLSHKSMVVGLKFSEQSNLLYSASYDGAIHLWDLRTSSTTSVFKDTTLENKTKYFNCFDISSNNRLVSAGTELYDGDSYILFWDIRNTKLLGAYWDSHTDDITQVVFHSSDPNKIISGSVDGLINIYDLTQNTEDDALIDTLNTESSIEKLSWIRYKGQDVVSCITHTNDLQIWRLEDASPFCDFKRPEIAKELKRKSAEHSYVVNAHNKNNEIFTVAGSNVKDGECVRGLKIENKCLKPAFRLTENTQRVRCSWFNENSNTLFTGGEKGILNAWKIDLS